MLPSISEQNPSSALTGTFSASKGEKEVTNAGVASRRSYLAEKPCKRQDLNRGRSKVHIEPVTLRGAMSADLRSGDSRFPEPP